MRNFIVTIDGKSYSVGVEEVGENDGAQIAPQPKAIPAAAPAAVIGRKAGGSAAGIGVSV